MDRNRARGPAGPDHVFVAPDRGRRVVRLALVVSFVGICAGTAMVVSERSVWSVGVLVLSTLLLVASWAVLQSNIPQRVTVSGSVIEIRRDGHTQRFDLEDPGVDILVSDGEIAFAQYKDGWVVVSAQDVDWKVFSEVVMHYQNQADHNAEERDKRFNL